MAAEAGPSAAPATQVWLVDSRCAPGCGDLEAGLAKINYWRLTETRGCGQWQASDVAAFQASADPAVPTTVLVHGYGTDADWAVRHGNEFYSLMKQNAGGKPFRLIVWSWPAERAVRGIRNDVQLKDCRSDADAYYLARTLVGLPRGEPLGLSGYSLGCRTVGGALQLLAGGAVGGRSLPAASLESWKAAASRPIRVMLIAAAVDADWLEPNGPFGMAPLATERILVSQNCGDRALKWYRLKERGGGAEALGRVGPAGTAGGKVELLNVECEVGRKHDFIRYEEAPSICGRIAWYTFLAGEVATAESPAQKPESAAR